MHSVLDWPVSHWPAVLAVLAGLISIAGTVRNILTYFGDGPRLKKAESILGSLSDVLAWVVKNGHDGPLSMLPGWLAALSLPLFPSRAQVAGKTRMVK